MNYSFQLCTRNEIKEFVEYWHYSKNINGLSSQYCFKLLDQDILIGGMIFGQLGMPNAWKKYVNNKDDIIELRRLCCIDDTLKNTESYFIGKALRWLKQNTNIKTVISYADPEYGHQGTIYKASNFKLIGQTAPGKVIIWNGKKYHDKSIRTKYKNELKPFAKKLKLALENNEAFYKATKGKNIFIYNLHK